MNLQNVDIKELKNSYELHQCDWAKRCLDNIEKEMKQLQTKANKYDALAEKIKNEVKELEIPIIIYGGRGNGKTYARAEKEAKKYILKHILELLEEEEI